MGNLPVFLAQLKDFHPKQQRKIVLRELLIALGVILLFMVIGQPILNFLDIDQHTVSLSGGIILFIISLKMIFPPEIEKRHIDHPRDPLIVPLAVPLVAGPAILASVIIYSGQVPSLGILFSAILIAWLVTTIILFCAPTISRLLGPKAILACERLMGLILTLIAIQMFINGIETFLTP